MTPKEHRIHKTRQRSYGPWKANMAGTSQQMAGLLTQMFSAGAARIDADGIVTLPPWAAPLFMAVAVKGNRIASGNFHADNFDDERVYLRMVEDMQRE